MSLSKDPAVVQPAHVEMRGFLAWLEKAGNKLPHPVTLFASLTVFVLILSVFTAGIEVTVPGTDKVVVAQNLLTASGIRNLITKAVSNFTGFPAIGTVVVVMLGVAVADETGLFRVMFRRILTGVKPTWVTAAVILMGLNSSIASDAGIIFMPALGALAFAAIGRHPFIGIAAGYASAAGGYFASLIVASHDANLVGLTVAAAKIVPATQNAPVSITMNWFMMIASVLVLLPVGTLITERIIAPRFEGQAWDNTADNLESQALTSEERRGLKWAGITTLGFIVLLGVLTQVKGALLWSEKGSVLTSFTGTIFLLMCVFFVAGFAYGKGAGVIRNGADVAKLMEQGVMSLAPFIVMAFFAAQLLGVFKDTNLATVVAVKGAEFLKGSGITGIPLLLGFVIFIGLIDLVLYSGSAKWALLAPVFIPMFGLLDISPAAALAAYRISDSTSNILSPLFPYLPLVLGLMQRYKKDAKVGTLISLMVPYSISYLVFWMILLTIWAMLDLPLGPGATFWLK